MTRCGLFGFGWVFGFEFVLRVVESREEEGGWLVFDMQLLISLWV